MTFNTDLDSHHIEGYARAAQERGLMGHFSVPLISHIHKNLWQGGCIDGVKLPDDFEFVVSLYPWEKYALGGDTARLEYELYDAAEVPDERQLFDVAHMVNAFADRGKTLVHCQAGLNRSGLIAGLALVLDGQGSPDDVIDLMREQRCDMVLCNGSFESWLRKQKTYG